MTPILHKLNFSFRHLVTMTIIIVSFSHQVKTQSIASQYGIHQFAVYPQLRDIIRKKRQQRLSYEHQIEFRIDSMGKRSDTNMQVFRYILLADGSIRVTLDDTYGPMHDKDYDTTLYDPFDRVVRQSILGREEITTYNDSLGFAIKCSHKDSLKCDSIFYDRNGRESRRRENNRETVSAYDGKGNLSFYILRSDSGDTLAASEHSYDSSGRFEQETTFENSNLHGHPYDLRTKHHDPIRHTEIDSIYFWKNGAWAYSSSSLIDSSNHTTVYFNLYSRVNDSIITDVHGNLVRINSSIAYSTCEYIYDDHGNPTNSACEKYDYSRPYIESTFAKYRPFALPKLILLPYSSTTIIPIAILPKVAWKREHSMRVKYSRPYIKPNKSYPNNEAE